MDYEVELDLTGTDEDQIEQGGRTPPGWYLCRLKEVYPDADLDCLKLVYEVTAGSYRGSLIRDSLWDPAASDTPDKEKSARQRMNLIAHRLGLWGKGDGGTRKGVNFAQAVGAEVAVNTQKRKDSDYANVTFDGVYPLDHHKLPDEVRKDLGITVPKRQPPKGEGAKGSPSGNGSRRPAAGAPAGAPAATRPRFDISDL